MSKEIESQVPEVEYGKGQQANVHVPLTLEEEATTKRYLRKIDMRVLPVVVLLYFASSLDRGNIGTATVNGLNTHLKLSQADQANVVSLFTICYLVFEAPANMLLKRTKPRYWFTFIVTFWSLSTFYLAYASSAALFILGRCLIGVFEAGFTPGIVAYLPYWYTRQELGSRMSVFFMALPISGMVGGPIAAKLVQTQILNLQRYQGIFFVEGLLTIAIGVLTFFVMYDYPDTAKFFTPEEKELVTRRITLDQGLASKAQISKRQTFNAFKDWKIYMFSFVGFGPNNCLVLLGYFGPTIIRGMGYSPTTATYMAGIPYACGILTMLVALRYINRIQLWKLYLVCIPVDIIGAVLTAFAKKPEVRFFGLCLIGASTCPITPVGMTWMSTNCGSVAKRMISTAIFTTITGLAGFFSPYIFTSKYAPNYTIGHIFNLIMLALSLCSALVLRFHFVKENARRDANPEDLSHLSLDEQQALNDKHPSFRYKLYDDCYITQLSTTDHSRIHRAEIHDENRKKPHAADFASARVPYTGGGPGNTAPISLPIANPSADGTVTGKRGAASAGELEQSLDEKLKSKVLVMGLESIKLQIESLLDQTNNTAADALTVKKLDAFASTIRTQFNRIVGKTEPRPKARSKANSKKAKKPAQDLEKFVFKNAPKK